MLVFIYICAILVFLNDVAYLYFYVAFYRYIYIQESMLQKSARLILIYGSLLTPGGECLHIPILVWLFVYILSISPPVNCGWGEDNSSIKETKATDKITRIKGFLLSVISFEYQTAMRRSTRVPNHLVRIIIYKPKSKTH